MMKQWLDKQMGCDERGCSNAQGFALQCGQGPVALQLLTSPLGLYRPENCKVLDQTCMYIIINNYKSKHTIACVMLQSLAFCSRNSCRVGMRTSKCCSYMVMITEQLQQPCTRTLAAGRTRHLSAIEQTQKQNTARHC